MLEIINKIFEINKFTRQEIQNGYLYFCDESSNKEAFWLVLEEKEIEKLIEKQSELFDACKKVCLSPALDKNISILILWNTGGKIEIQKMKEHIISVEEDQYYFKKYVLYFSDEELQDLKSKLGNASISGFMQEQLVSPNTFAKYKEDSINQSQTWQTLLYRIAMKLPFIKVEVEKKEELASLFTNNDAELNKKTGLLEFKENFFNKFLNLDVTKMDSEEWFKKLLPLLEESNYGN